MQITCVEENTEKYITFSVPIEEEVARIDKKVNEIKKLYLTDFNLLIVEDLWQAHYQILLIILLKKFTKLNGNTNTTIKNVKLAESNKNIATGFFLFML